MRYSLDALFRVADTRRRIEAIQSKRRAAVIAQQLRALGWAG